MKRILAGILAISMLFCLAGCKKTQEAADFYAKVEESKVIMDAVANAVLANWYDAIYEDAFNNDINEAINKALTDHEEDLKTIVLLDGEITELFKKIKDDKTYGTLCKNVMDAYETYYESVVKVNGSYNSFSEEIEQFETSLTSALRDLSYEL